MKIYLLLAIFVLLNIINVSAQQPSFNDTIVAYFDDVKAVTAENKNIWDYDLYAPILLVQRNTREIYSNFPDSTGMLKKDGPIYTGILPQAINIANTATHWSGVDWAMLILPLPTDRNDRLNLLTHELFHNAQPHLGFKLNNTDNNHLDKKEGRIYSRLELEALKAALLATSYVERQKHITDALTFRNYRYTIYPKADSTENMLELNEGLAEYTGVMMSKRDLRKMQNHFIESIKSFLTNPTFVRSFAYQTIPLYGYLLQSTDKNWNKHIIVTTNLAAYFLQAFNVHLPQDLKSTANAITNTYNGQTIIAEENAREERINKLIAAYKKAFIEEPHLDIPLQHMNVSFDPRNIIPLEDKGTVYPNVRITDKWGILTVTKGALMSPSWNKITITLPTGIDKEKVLGDGWTLELKPDYFVEKDSTSKSYILKKR